MFHGASHTQQAMQTSELPIIPPTHPLSQPAFHQETRPMDTRQVIQSQQAYPSQHQYQRQLFASSLLLDGCTAEGSQNMSQIHVPSRAHLTSSAEAYGNNNTIPNNEQLTFSKIYLLTILSKMKTKLKHIIICSETEIFNMVETW